MSSFLHSDSTYDRIFWTIEAAKLSNAMVQICFADIYDLKMFIKDLHDWNHRSVNERYKNDAGLYEVPLYEPVAKSPKLTSIELVKLLQSINYQCNDCSAYETSHEHAVVEKIINKLLRHIVNELPEYHVAAWS